MFHLKQQAKYVAYYYNYAQLFYSERAVISFLKQRRYRWRDIKTLGDGEWATKDKRILIRQIKVKHEII